MPSFAAFPAVRYGSLLRVGLSVLRFQGGSRAWGKATNPHRGTRDAAARQQGEKALQVDPHALDQVSGSQVDPHALDQVPASLADVLRPSFQSVGIS